MTERLLLRSVTSFVRPLFNRFFFHSLDTLVSENTFNVKYLVRPNTGHNENIKFIAFCFVEFELGRK
jgi:hypothetical protein